MELLSKTLFTLNAEPVTLLRLVWAVVALALVLGIGHLCSAYMRRRLFGRGHGNPPTEKSVMRICRALAAVVGLLLALRIVGLGLTGILWSTGIAMLALVLVARQTLANYFAGLVLLYERPVSVGDHVQIGTQSGEVEAIRLRVTHVRTPGNTRLIIPNSLFMRDAITNVSAPDGRIRLCIAVQVAHGSDANDVIMALRRVAERNPRVRKNPAPRSLMTGLVPDGMQFELWAWIGDPSDAPWVENELYRGIDSELQKARIRLSGRPSASSSFSPRRQEADEAVSTPRPPSPRRPEVAEVVQTPRPPSPRRPEVADVVKEPPAPKPEPRTAEQTSEQESPPKRSRARARSRRGKEPVAASEMTPLVREERVVREEREPADTPDSEFTLLEQPELSFESEKESDEPRFGAGEEIDVEPTAVSVPEVVVAEPPTTVAAPGPEVRRADEPVTPDPVARPTFGRSKRKVPRR